MSFTSQLSDQKDQIGDECQEADNGGGGQARHAVGHGDGVAAAFKGDADEAAVDADDVGRGPVDLSLPAAAVGGGTQRTAFPSVSTAA